MDDEFSTNDVILELQQARRSFQIFEHGEQVVRYLLTVEQRQKDAEAAIGAAQAKADQINADLAERVKVGELRAEAAEQKAADLDKQMTAAQAAANQAIADAKAKLAVEIDAGQQKLVASKAALATLTKQITDAKTELAALLQKIADAKKTMDSLTKPVIPTEPLTK